MTVHDGDTAVRGYYHDSRVAFPDQGHEIIALRHSDDAVTVEAVYRLEAALRDAQARVPLTVSSTAGRQGSKDGQPLGGAGRLCFKGADRVSIRGWVVGVLG